MFKKLAFLCKKEGTSTQEFINYYEEKHVPLICSLAPIPLVYKRRYLLRNDLLNHEDNAITFDVVTEVGFQDRSAYLAWIARLSEPGIDEKVAKDEAQFLNRSLTRSYVIEEHVTSE